MHRLANITVKSVDELLMVPSVRGEHITIADRQYCGLSFCKSGQITYDHNGKRTVSDRTRAIYLPKGETYRLYRDATGDFPVINFTCTEDPDIRDHLALEIRNPDAYIRDFERMYELSLFPYNRLQVLSIFYGILHRLVSETVEHTGILAPVLAYIEKHYTDWDLSNDLLAAQAGVSEVYLRQLFRRQMGTSPKQYIMDLRLERAKQLLTESSRTVTDIASECGFTTLNHFCHGFRASTGQTPGEYRRDNRKKM